MLRLLLLLPGVLGCSSTLEETHELSSLKRSYVVTRRKTHDPKQPAPVLFCLHAYATKPGVTENATDLDEIAVERRGFILVTPRGLTDSHGNPFWNATRACCDGERHAPDDVGYLRQVLADVRRHYAVDPTRVYALGVSNGGFMAQRWACEPGGDLTGIISVSGAGLSAADAPCRPSRPVSVVHIHGDADDVVAYAGGEMDEARYPAAKETVEGWARLNGCPSSQKPARTSWERFGLEVTEETYPCPGAAVTLWQVAGGKHNLRLRRRPIEQALGLVDRSTPAVTAPPGP